MKRNVIFYFLILFTIVKFPLYSNTPPIITNISPISPITIASGSIYMISYYVEDAESTNLVVELRYNTNQAYGGWIIISSNYVGIGTNIYNWDTSGVMSGEYYIIGKVIDSSNAYDIGYSAVLRISNTNTTVASNNAPETPSWAYISASSSNVYLVWNDVTNEEGYRVYRSTNNNTNSGIVIGTTAVDETNYNDINVLASKVYYYWLKATNGYGESGFSQVACVTTGSITSNTNINTPPIITNISPISAVTLSAGDIYTINYEVYDAEDTNLYVELYYSTNYNIPLWIIMSNIVTKGSNSYNWDTTGVIGGRCYWIIGRVKDSSNSWATNYSASILYFTNTTTNTNKIDTIPPAVPMDIKLFPGDRQIVIKWCMNTEPDFKEYYIYRRADTEDSYKIIAVVTGTNYYVDSNLKNGVLYSYKLRAIDTNGNLSDFSQEGIAMPISLVDDKNYFVVNDNKITPDDKDRNLVISINPLNNSHLGEATMYIYDITMRLVRKLKIDRIEYNKQYILEWDLKDEDENYVPTGVYFIWIIGDNWKVVRRVYVVR